MQANQRRALDLVLEHEGGYVNHPKDPGGATNKGVTQGVYDAYRLRKGQQVRSVKSITKTELNEIYDKQYWDVVRADELPHGLDYCVFDYAVNSGPSRAVKDLQRVLGVGVDGVIGNVTLKAAVDGDTEKIIEDLCARRLRFLKSLKTWATFGRGWGRRVDGVRAHALQMARGDHDPKSVPAVPTALMTAAAAPAPESKQAALKTAQGAGASLGGVGAAGQTLLNKSEELKPHFNETLLGQIIFWIFLGLIVVGGALIVYAQVRKIKEAGGLSGFFQGVFK